MKRFEKLRKNRNLSQQQVADMLGTTQQAYSNYEKGKREADYETLAKLADCFGTTTDYLIGVTDDPAPPNKKTEPPSSSSDHDIVTIQRLHSKLSPKDKEKFMKLLRIQFEEDFPKDSRDPKEKEEDDNGLQEQKS